MYSDYEQSPNSYGMKCQSSWLAASDDLIGPVTNRDVVGDTQASGTLNRESPVITILHGAQPAVASHSKFGQRRRTSNGRGRHTYGDVPNKAEDATRHLQQGRPETTQRR